MNVLKDIGVCMLAGAATTVGVMLAHKGINIIANPMTKEKLKSKLAGVRNKFKKQ